MKRPEMLYVLAVLVTAAVLAGNAWHLAVRPGPDAPHAWRQGRGRPRRVDIEQIQRLIHERRLSDHPALFTHPAD